MNPELKFITLGEIGRVAMCKRVLKKQTDEKEEIPFYKISTFGQTPMTFISRELFENFKSKYSYPKKGDILISAAGTIGKTVIFDGRDSYFQDSNIVWIDNDELKVTNQFLYYYYQTKPWIPTNGSTIKRLYNEDIRSLVITYPSHSEQKKITKILSDLDSKIELNNKINAELESMAKLIYDYWFVQLDFPDENGKPYKSSGGKMVYNEKLNREIPQDWSNGELQDIANITMGQSPSGDSYNEDRNGEVFYQGCTDFGLRFPTNRKFTTQPTRFAKTGDILLSVRAPVGTMNIANEDCCIGRGLAALNSKNGSITHLDGVLQHMKQIFDLMNSSGTTFGSITKGDLFSIPVVIPDKKTLQRFDEVTNPMFEKQNLIGSENQMLEELRDWLLPMLMNGQVTIKD